MVELDQQNGRERKGGLTAKIVRQNCFIYKKK